METLTAMLDSLRPADSARSVETAQHRRPTSKDILAGGYNCQREIPEPVECEFCGRKLYHEALVMGRTVLMFAPFPQRCTCEQAKAKWAEADAEEARQKAEAEKEAAQAKRRAKIARKARCAEMLQAMRLESLAKRYPAQLSGGQCQKRTRKDGGARRA